MDETLQPTENQQQTQPNTKDIESLLEVVRANTQIESAVMLLTQTDFTVIKKMIEKTPPELQDSLNFKILSLFNELNDKLTELNGD